MTCITGETGAGKSIMLDALGLCIGDRADSRAIRPGAPRTDIAACFDVSQNTRAQVWLSKRDLEAAGDCILRRTITAEGRSRAYINGSPATLSDCADQGSCSWISTHSMRISHYCEGRSNGACSIPTPAPKR